MSDKEHSPTASPRHEDDNDSRSPKSPRAGSASPKSAADDAEGASAENVGRRATSRSPSPVGGAAAAGAASNERGAVRTEPDAANPGNNLYIANLPDRFTQPDMEELFNKFGRVEKCEVIIDPVTRESRGFGFVSYEDVRDATDAVAELNGKEVQGRRIRVEHAKRQRGHEKTPGKYLGPRQASTKYGIRGMSGGRSRSRSRGDRGGDRGGDRFRPRSRSRSRDRGRRYDSYDSRDRYDRGRYEDRGRGYDRDRYERRSRR